jgi:hypothetical protein
MKIHEKNRTKSYKMAETYGFGLIFMKIHEKIVQNYTISVFFYKKKKLENLLSLNCAIM